MYCKRCGAEVGEYDEFCKSCGAQINGADNAPRGLPVSRKSRLVTVLLAWFFGVFGIHRFYVGRWFSGILMILTLGGIGIWALVDFIVALCGDFKDSSGLKITVWLDEEV